MDDNRISEIRAVLADSAELGDEEAAVHMLRIQLSRQHGMLQLPEASDE